jgi:hypothetical protein
VSGTRRLRIEILGDAKGLAGAVTDADGLLGRLGGSVKTVAKVGALAIGGLTTAAVAFGPALLDAGLQYDALEAKQKTVFEGSLGNVKRWAAENAKAMGLTIHQASSLAAGFADLLKPMGFTADQAAGMSTDILNLSGALSAWSGGKRSAAEVSEILAKAMLGERDGLKELGISISEADVQAALAAKGQEKLTGAALEQAKALATQELIFAKSADAQKAWGDGTFDAIKKQNEMKASIEKLKELGIKALQPVLAKTASFLSDKFVPAVTAISSAFGEGGLSGVMKMAGKRFSEAWPGIKAALGDIGRNIGRWIADTTPVLLRQLGEWGQALIDWIGPRIRPMLSKLGELIGVAANWLLDEGLPKLVDNLVKWGDAFVAWVAPLIPPFLVELGKLLLEIGRWIVTEAAPKILVLAAKLGWALINWAVDIAVPLLKELGGLLVKLGAWFVTDAIPWMAVKAAELGAAFVKWAVAEIVKFHTERLPQWLTDLGVWFVNDALPWIAAKGIELGKNLVDKFKEEADKLVTERLPQWLTDLSNWFLALPGKLKELFVDAASWLVDAGKRIIEGLGNGIASAAVDIPKIIAEKIQGKVLSIPGLTSDGTVLRDYVPPGKSASAPAPKHSGGTAWWDGLYALRAGEEVSTPGRGGGTNQPIVIELDGAVLATAVVDRSHLTGGLPIRIRPV